MESNKLIAEFMGLETPNGIYFEYLTKDGERSKLTHFILLEYHLSWDWLMKVVDKIESLGYSYDRINADVFINNQNGENVIPNPMDENTMTMIEKTYYVVLEFIKQYNDEQNKA